MSVFNFFRNIFGGRDGEELRHEGLDDQQSRKHSFRNPIWQNDDDENDDDDFRHFGNTIHFSIFSDPMEMTRYFEAQMDEILKSFFPGSGRGSFFSIPDRGNVPEVIPIEPRQDNLRNKMLKPGYDMPGLDDYGKSRADVDLDGKISAEDFSKIWEEPDSKKQIVPYTNQFHHSSRFVTKRFVRGPDGTIEEQETIRDGEGNEETIVSKQIGDKKYVVTTKKDKNGIETKTEDLINIDESEMKNFEQKWGFPFGHDSRPSSILNYFPWEKFFGPNPKL
ncbi:hypothetical protein KPH14_002629 [Odynerus spinipes]|uniref:HCLS1-associated protein X-1 n=1 Tax=Odynerus spinipes TaxID=1348599 RepID=A0AAD9VLR5_9HYME|nr:hypothetical protein KPH14_002629 [Odynerus spinipes]